MGLTPLMVDKDSVWENMHCYWTNDLEEMRSPIIILTIGTWFRPPYRDLSHLHLI